MIIRELLLLCSLLFFLPTYGQGKITRTPRIENKQKYEISKPDGYINGHGYVDLGLPSGVKWATMNIGATQATEDGYYYAWGEVSLPPLEKIHDGSEVPSYSIKNCKLYGMEMGNISGTSNDVASAKWGEGWVLPTEKDAEELAKYCKHKVVNIEGVYGFKITGPNGNSIFIPCTATYGGTIRPSKHEDSTNYWIGDEYGENSGRVLGFNRIKIHITTNRKNIGYAIRAIAKIK